MSEVKLTRLSHGGGCGCKIAPALLQQILGIAKDKLPFANLLVGTMTSGAPRVAVSIAYQHSGYLIALPQVHPTPWYSAATHSRAA